MSPLPANMEAGPQPIDEICQKHEIHPTALIKASTDRITHKELRKARNGRKLTRRMQNKILNALNAYLGRHYKRQDLFNYEGH